MASYCCCCCYKPEEPEEDYEVYVVEDGDELQNFGVRHTLELLRRMMNQNGRPIVDQPPPSYAEFDKYPLANEDEDIESKSSPSANLSEPRYQAAPNWGTREAAQPRLGASSLSMLSPQSTWIEPFPKPPGEPPPVPSNWFLTRLASMRRSLVARLAPSTTTVSPPPMQPTLDPPGETIPQVVNGSPTSEPMESIENENPIHPSSNSPSRSPIRKQDSVCSNSFTTAHSEASELPRVAHNPLRLLTAQSSVQTEFSDEHVITIPPHATRRQFSRSVIDLKKTYEMPPVLSKRNSL